VTKKRRKPELVLGLVSSVCAGKSTLSEFLINKYGFFHTSFSGIIKEEIEKKGQEVNRDRLQAVGGELREKYGPEILAKRVWERVLVSGKSGAVVDGLRSVEEARFLKGKPNFYLIAVLAKPRIRYQRMIKRGRKGESLSWKEFQKMEERDKKAEGRDIVGCLKMADFKIENNGTIKEFQEKIEVLSRKLR
jgi:dephospho-CoA kinase